MGGASEGGSANNLDWRRRLAAGDSLVVAIFTNAVDKEFGTTSTGSEMKLQKCSFNWSQGGARCRLGRSNKEKSAATSLGTHHSDAALPVPTHDRS